MWTLQKETVSNELNAGSSESCLMALTMLKTKSFTIRALVYAKDKNEA